MKTHCFVVAVAVVLGAGRASASCPSTLGKHVVPHRTFDTRESGHREWAAYKKMRWAPGHTRALARGFWTAPAKAIAAVVAVEQQHPEVVPEPYRERLRAAPRDAALRLEMAECEAAVPETRRRAASDAAMAELLGADSARAEQVIVDAVQRNIKRGVCGQDKPCADTAQCYAKYDVCLEPEEYHLAASELAIEEALTRAIMAGPVTKGLEPTKAQDGWQYAMRVRCGGFLCKLEKYDNRGYVAWDIRDGGSSHEVPLSKREIAQRDRCEIYTGQTSLERCEDKCRIRDGSSSFYTTNESCIKRCKAFCH